MTSFALIVSFLLVGYGFLTHRLWRGQKKIALVENYTQFLIVCTMMVLFWPILITLPLLRTKKT